MNLLDKPYILLQDSRKKQTENTWEWIYRYLYVWPWILFCLLICFMGGFAYISFTPAKYKITAKVSIKDQNDQPATQVALKELQLFQDRQVVDNEIEVLKSMQLIRNVVRDLSLYSSYSLKGFPVSTELYDTIPFVFIPVNVNVSNVSLAINIKNRQTFILNSGKSGTECGFGKLQKTNFGTWIITPTSNIQRFIGKTIIVSYVHPEIASASYLSKLDVSQSVKLSSIIEMTVEDNIPQRGKQILNSLIENYDLISKGEKNKLATSALEFIDNRLSSLRGELASAEKNVEGYRSSKGLTNISEESTLYLDQVQENDHKLNEVNVQLKILEEVERNMNSKNGGAPATIGISDPALIDLIRNLNTVQFQREHLLAANSNESPLLEPLDRQIRSTKLLIQENISNIRASLNAVKSQLDKFNSGFESSIKQLPGQERQLVDIQRKQSIKENLYIYLMQKREEVALSFASSLPGNRVIDAAYSTHPYWPNKSLIYLCACLFGFLVPASFLLGKEILSPRITSKLEIQSAVPVPIISELIHQGGKPIFVLDDRRNVALAEQLRSLRTNVKLSHNSRQSQVTLMTSSVGNEGKSFVGSNLAVAFAVSGRRTVILELDLRKPKITEMFNLSSDYPGISDFLMGEAALDDIIQFSGKSPNLDVIGAGRFVENPAEVLEYTALDVLIADLKLRYDNVILDSPPVHLVTDAMILARFADVTLYLIRQGFTSKSELNFISQLIDDKIFPNINIVFNGIHRRKYGYGYNYDRSYYGKRKLRLN
jgi:tyrosine-protein kinase Etk/Wzc